MEKIIDDKYMSVYSEDSFLTLSWKAETVNFTDGDFKEEALKFIGVVQNLQSKNILVDMRKFAYTLSADLISWRNENLISIYNKINVRKFAFISDKPTVNQDDPKNVFITKTFVSDSDAKIWLAND